MVMEMEQEEMKFLGFFGILRESFKIIKMGRKILGQIALSFILPLIFISLSHIEVNNFLIRKIAYNQIVFKLTQTGTSSDNKLSGLIAAEQTYLLLFNLLYIIITVILYLLATSAVVYTVACIYSGREVTFKKVITVVPKVFKRLIITYLCFALFIFLYNLVAAFIIGFGVALIAFFVALIAVSHNNSTGPLIVAVAVLLFCVDLVGLVYMILIWKLGYVISALEDIRGTKALQKSRNLLKGKTTVATILFITTSFLPSMIPFAFQKLVVNGGRSGMVSRLAYGLICFLVVFMVYVLGLVAQTVFYFVCKSFHHENVDKIALSDHLEVYSGAYTPLKSKDYQLENLQV